MEKLIEDEDAHEIDTGNGCSGGCDLLAGSDCRNNAHLVMSILNAIQKNILVHKFRIRLKRQVLSCSVPAETHDNKEAQATTSAAAKKNEECLDKDAEILRLIEERRSMPKEEKQRLKDLSKSRKNASEKKKNEETARH